MSNGEVTVKREVIENGPRYTSDVLWFVDCDGYSFGTYDTEVQAACKRTWLYEQFEHGWTPREVYNGFSGSTEVA